MDMERPLLIVGSGRSGSTVFHDLLSNHSDIFYLSDLCDRFPSRPKFNQILMKAIDVPLLGRPLLHRYPPGECYTYWDRLFPGFSTPCRDLVAADLTAKGRRRIHRSLSQMTTHKRKRLLLKITGWPRLGFLRELFADGKFIHVIRDGRAVANSLLSVDWWWGWRGPENWRWGVLPQPLMDEWDRHDRSFVALAAIQWKLLMDAMETARDYVDRSAFMEVKYEDVCSDTVAALRAVSNFGGLEWSTRFERAVSRFTLRSANDKWRTELTARQQKILELVLADHLTRYGYS